MRGTTSLFLFVVPLLFSCSSSSSSSVYVDPKEGDPFFEVVNKTSLKELGASSGKQYLPSTGAQSLLVIPVTVEGYESNATEENRKNLEKTFNGLASETGYQSVSSFYKESSFGKLELTATVSDWYPSGLTTTEILALNTSADSLGGVHSILENALEWYKNTNSTGAAEFDKNADGTIDAIWLVYSAPDFRTDATLDETSHTFWAFSSGVTNESNILSPGAGIFSWASYDFMYRGYGSTKLDAHTYIHETGHLLGLSDYYDYDKKRAPMGGIDMMDRNIIDHNCYSKFSLGWVNPYYADHTSTITLRSSVSTGDCLLIPTSASWNGTAFDEYLMAEFYTPTGLNESDAKAAYAGTFPKAFSKPGIRIYHVDARMCLYEGGKKGYTDTLVKDEDTTTVLAHSNTASLSKTASVSLLQVIDNSGVKQNKVTTASTDEALFYKGDAFSFASYRSQFPYSSQMDDGGYLPYSITVDSVSSYEAKLSVSSLPH